MNTDWTTHYAFTETFYFAVFCIFSFQFPACCLPVTCKAEMKPFPSGSRVSFYFCLVISPLCYRVACYDAIVSLFLQKLLLQGHNIRYKVMEPFIHCRVSLEINNGQMESLNTTDVKLLVILSQWNAGEDLLINASWWITPLVLMGRNES